MAVSFWPIMYSRFGVRHIGVLPWMLGAFYLLYPSPRPSLSNRQRVVQGCGHDHCAWPASCLAAALMTYFAGRAVPIILIGFLVYLAHLQSIDLRRVWWRYLAGDRDRGAHRAADVHRDCATRPAARNAPKWSAAR